jgi:hypothetical protein
VEVRVFSTAPNLYLILWSRNPRKGSATMRPLIIAGILVIAVAGSASAQSVGGPYTVKGTNPDGSSYGGTAVITPRGDGCHIAWDVGSQWQGLCMLNGDALAASYSSGKSSGLLIYKLQPDGTLRGVWVLNDGGTGTETLIPTR